ncbi:MAG: hypothetical protein O9284_14340 [Steroidobacteraceae bacterium]|jgi:pimeloyl-ACP methyl ester carboxylesterase|nr:hypothetical protein [Steroidobacteraceae bacterium]
MTPSASTVPVGPPLACAVQGRGEIAVALIHGRNCDSSHWGAQLGARALRAIGADTPQQLGPQLPPDQLEARLAPLRQDFAGTVRGFVLGSFFVPQSDPALQEPIANAMAAAHPEVGVPALLGLNDWYAPAPAARFADPVVLLNAAQPPGQRPQVAATLSRLEERTFDGVGHFLMMEAPGPFNAVPLEEPAELRAAAATR